MSSLYEEHSSVIKGLYVCSLSEGILHFYLEFRPQGITYEFRRLPRYLPSQSMTYLLYYGTLVV